MHIGYKRVSTEDQSTARQLVGIELQRVYEDKASGATKDRPQLKACLDALREGDTLHVHAVDRLSRSLRDLLDIVDQVLKAKATLIIYSPRLEFGYQSDDYLQTFQLQLFAIVGQLERAMSRHRQKEGIAAAKKNGTKSGKPWGKQPLCPTLKPKAIDLFNQGISITTIATDLGISRGSVYNLLKGQTKTVQY
jgi:DNA invertase Pin-like site-specific DNA recombinase